MNLLGKNIMRPRFKISSKYLDRNGNEYVFILETCENKKIRRTAGEIAKEIDILSNLSFEDIYNVGYTHGIESILKERFDLSRLKDKA